MSKKKPSFNEIAKTNKIQIQPVPINEEQTRVRDSIANNNITFAYGPPGTGKTMLATMTGLNMLLNRKIDKLVLTKPIVDAYRDRIGTLPGDKDEKMSPYIRPIKSFLEEQLNEDALNKFIKDGDIEITPLGYMLGLNYKKTYIVLDEAQNTQIEQMRLLLTRIDDKSKVVVTGDLYQSNDRMRVNGLSDAIDRLQDLEGVGICELTEGSIVRGGIVAAIEKRYRNSGIL